jgi:hypothetical protein
MFIGSLFFSLSLLAVLFLSGMEILSLGFSTFLSDRECVVMSYLFTSSYINLYLWIVNRPQTHCVCFVSTLSFVLHRSALKFHCKEMLQDDLR